MNWQVEIRRFRQLHGHTQRALAELIGADATSISSWERGRDQPSLEFQRRLLELIKGGTPDTTSASFDDVTDWPGLIKHLRKCRAMSQTHLSEILGVDPTTISRWERGRDMPSLVLQRTLRSLASEH